MYMTIFQQVQKFLIITIVATWCNMGTSIMLKGQEANVGLSLPTSTVTVSSSLQSLPGEQEISLYDSLEKISPEEETALNSSQLTENITQNSGEQLPQIDSQEKGHIVDPEPDNSSEPADIFLNFENSALLSVVNYLAEQKKINIIPHRDLETVQVSLTTRTPLTLTRAWNVLLTLMEMNGFSIIKVGELYRVVASRENGLEPLPIYSSEKGTQPEDLPDSDQIVRYVYFFQNMRAEIAQGILGTMLEGDNNKVIINRDLNACVIKHQCHNIKAAMKIIKELDGGGLRESIRMIKLKYTNADMVVRIFDEILGQQPPDKVIRLSALPTQKETSYFSSNTRIFPEPVKNMIIMLGTEKHLDKITEFITNSIDIPQETASSRFHIKEVKYARAEQLKPILETIIRPPRGQGSDRSALVGEYKFFEDVVITAEEPKDERSGFGGGNRLIVACGKDDWVRLERLIDKLDKPHPQVALEIMIINTELRQDNALGAQVFNLLGKKPGLGIDMVEFKNLSNTQNLTSAPEDYPTYIEDIANTSGAGGPSFITFGRAGTLNNPENNLWGIVRTLCNLNNSHIISQPFLVANNHQLCKLSINETRRVPGALVDSSRLSDTRRRQEEIQADTTVEITPNINRDGIIKLDIYLTINEFLETGSTDQPPRSKRRLQTKTIMATGEVIVLGGFLTKNDRISQHKTPLLGDIPIFGTLFRSKSVTREDRNVYIFIRPSIIKPQFEGAPDEYTQLKLDYAKYQSIRNDTYAKEKDPIQRWFFKPSHQTTRHTIADARRGIYRPVDDFTYGKSRPKSVNVQLDPYYKVSSEAKKERERQKKRSLKRMQDKKQASRKQQSKMAKS